MINLDSYQIFADNKASLKETSKDDSDSENIKYMTDSEQEVINFDLVKRKYVNELGLSEDVAKSVDAIIQLEDSYVFIEFKNGKVNNRDIKDKARDTLLIFNDITKENADFSREKIDFIVVYNLEANPLPNQFKKGQLQESSSRIAIQDIIAKRAGKHIILFDLERYKRLYFREVYTFSKNDFESYLRAQS